MTWHRVICLRGRSGFGMRAGDTQRRHFCQRQDKLTRYAVFVTMLIMGFSLAVPVQAQTTSSFTPLSSIPGLTPPETATGITVQTLCPQLSPNVTTGGVGDLQIRCTEMIGNALAGNTSAASDPLLPLAPEEIVAQGKSAVETSNRNIGARLASLHGGVTSLSFRRFTLWNEEPTVPYTLVASLAPFAAVNSVVAASTPSAFSRLGFFANGTFTSGDKDATSQEAGFDFKTYGATLGADYRFTDNFVLGVTFNYMSTNIDFDSFSFLGSPDGGGIDTKSFGFSIYGTYYVSNQFYVDGIFNFGRNHYDIDRRIIYSIPSTDRTGTLIPGATTTVNQTAQGGTNSTQYSFSVGTGYDFHVQGFTVTPFARLEYSKLDVDGYQEAINNTADGFGLALAFDSQDVESLLSGLGAQASYAISTGIGVLLPQVRAEWRHEFKNDARTITSRFVSDPARTPLLLVTDSPDRDFFTLGGSLSATFRGGVAAFVSYEAVVGLSRVTSNNVVGGIRLEF
jgi:outer membrane lipase/esterase